MTIKDFYYRWIYYFPDRVRDVKYYIRNRFINRTHIIYLTNHPKGQWRDTDTRAFEAMLQLLVEFVEEECSHMNKIMYTKGKQYDDIHPDIVRWHNENWWNKWRNRKYWNEKLGIAHLEWEINLVNQESTGEPHETEYSTFINIRQSESAKKKLELYLWYKYERSKRPDPWDNSTRPEHLYIHEKGGFTDWMIEDEPSSVDENGKPLFYRGRQATEEYREWVRKSGDLEQEQYEEDTRKAQEVLEIRQSLWT